MKTYTVTFNNVNDSRTVISAQDYRTALEVYRSTKEHRRFFQDDLSKEEKNSGVVALICDQTDNTIYESACRKQK